MSDIMTTDHNAAANDTAPESAVVKSIEISASTSDVWRTLTEPDKIAQWIGLAPRPA